MSESNGDLVAAPEADLSLARRTAVVSHGVVIKFQEMGLPEGLSAELARLSSDLGDLSSAQKTLTDRLQGLVDSPDDWEVAGDYLVDLRASVDHIAWHTSSVRRPLTKIAQFAYRKAAEAQDAICAVGRTPYAPTQTYCSDSTAHQEGLIPYQ